MKRQGLWVVVLDQADSAMQASGRHGGNFELIPENYFGRHGTHDGFVAERAHEEEACTDQELLGEVKISGAAGHDATADRYQSPLDPEDARARLRRLP